MEKMKPLVIGDLVIEKPVIQGGMGVGISLSSLAGAVAKAGGVGIISTAQIGFREPDFKENPLKANLRAIGSELKKAREIAPKGAIGFNIMVATRNYEEYVKTAVKAGADIIISGAGLPVSLPEYVREAEGKAGDPAAGLNTKLAPIVSSLKSVSVICKLWERKYQTTPDLVVIEGPLAGGHLGFSREQLAELDEINEQSREYEMKRQAVQMAAEHLEQLSGAMRGYLKRDLNEKASAIIREITGGKYTKLVTDEKLHVSLVTDEKLVEIEQVSRGTVEQIYLALRMAVGELLCEEEMPVILDDVFAYYDEERMLQTLKWLKAHKKQVLLFTCQKREEQVMNEAGIAYHKIEL